MFVQLNQAQLGKGPLVLVNRTHPLRHAGAAQRTPALPGYPDIPLQETAARMLVACVAAAGGTGEIVPVSGWRSRAEQQQIWDDTLQTEGEQFTRQYVAYPGCSEHETGLAIDLALQAENIDFICPEFPYDGVCGKFRALAARYGFIERYRADKAQTTGIAVEPWHFRYVGAPHATLMAQQNLCLEEYLDWLREAPRHCTMPNGHRATVRWLPTATQELQLPEAGWQLSGDNDSGFVLTQWEEDA